MLTNHRRRGKVKHKWSIFAILEDLGIWQEAWGRLLRPSYCWPTYTLKWECSGPVCHSTKDTFFLSQCLDILLVCFAIILFFFIPVKINSFFKKYMRTPGQVPQLVGISSHAPKGCGFNPQSGDLWEATERCFSLTLKSPQMRMKKKLYKLWMY